MDLFKFTTSAQPFQTPVIFSVPHSGTFFPEHLRAHFKKQSIEKPQDTDWFVDQIYSFAPQIGCAFLVANYNRYVIDLNRSKKFSKLYDDERTETTLVPLKSFSNEDLYNHEPNLEDINNRIQNYYDPYYKKLELELNNIRSHFKNVLLIDCHSVNRVVKTIQPGPFKDIILGTIDHTSADKKIIDICQEHLKNGPYETVSNSPFKGGNISRHFANPTKGIHCIQIEMSNDLYLKENAIELDLERSLKLSAHLQELTLKLINYLTHDDT